MPMNREISRYTGYFGRMTREINTLKSDLELVEKGWTIHLAIDFAELFAFAFPSTQVSHLRAQPGEQETELYSREQAALTFLFSKLKERVLTPVPRLILLPPYLDELRSAITILQLKRLTAYSWPGIMRALENRAFGEGFVQIEDIVKRYIESDKIPETLDEREAIASYIEKEYGNVVSLLATTDFRRGLAALKTIVDSGIICTVRAHFAQFYQSKRENAPDLRDAFDEGKNKRRSEEWLGKLMEMRPTRPVANEIDACACAMINSINEKLVERKGVLLMISHSRAVRKAAKNTPLAQQVYGTIEAKSGIRDLDYLWLYYVHREATAKNTLKRVNDTSQLLRRFAELRRRLNWSAKSQKEILSAAEDTLQKCANLSLGATTVVPMLKWFGDTRKHLPWKYARSERVGRAILSMVREGGMSAELIARRDYEKNKFESLMQYIMTGLMKPVSTDS